MAEFRVLVFVGRGAGVCLGIAVHAQMISEDRQITSDRNRCEPARDQVHLPAGVRKIPLRAATAFRFMIRISKSDAKVPSSHPSSASGLPNFQ
jgi:hypothetical protein